MNRVAELLHTVVAFVARVGVVQGVRPVVREAPDR